MPAAKEGEATEDLLAGRNQAEVRCSVPLALHRLEWRVGRNNEREGKKSETRRHHSRRPLRPVLARSAPALPTPPNPTQRTSTPSQAQPVPARQQIAPTYRRNRMFSYIQYHCLSPLVLCLRVKGNTVLRRDHCVPLPET
ncbi:hypothetical protein E2C01_033586 [Portunus trituberculatus]|uniref:Uncharacterized protein n=1 Tax=Portunus trituberculatus TaxID=210409 RepID=A0A5B7F0I3_PORTR|nr:hypothetical protein [Portunus trituberculatus]